MTTVTLPNDVDTFIWGNSVVETIAMNRMNRIGHFLIKVIFFLSRLYCLSTFTYKDGKMETNSKCIIYLKISQGRNEIKHKFRFRTFVQNLIYDAELT